ncbi:hypothetical protein ACJ72_05464 [Emergomyces africanus]|uniref:Major facilitator superfamily (MFS) profile domain-containing protein n=1 Tax=Emergomyces africanus TaxID=1955775 RepID=A0A1B7NTV6_9EURO|nr:hypothetical protein ACJ72_05464 [Emergomyces africanus]
MEMNNDEETLRQIEKELDTKIYPGTEIMTDVGSYHFVKSSERSDRVLVPQPSKDPNDPLNWSPFWKTTAMFLSTAVTFTQAFGPLALGPMFPQLIQDFDTDLAGAVKFTGVCILVLGFSNFFWVPLQTCFGRRPVLIFSTLVCLIASIWRGLATSYGSFMGASILNGFGAGPAETAQPQIIADIMFLHERGAYNTLYFTFYFGALVVSPVISGSMAYNIHWRHFWWLNVGLLGFVLALLIFLFPETRWHRNHPKELVGENEATENGITSVKADSTDTASQKPSTEHKIDNEHKNRDPYLLGTGIGLATNGYLSDWISMRATRKNKGIREPEMRLPAMIPYVVIMIIGNFVVAFGYEHKWDWKVIVIIGYTAIGIQVAALPAIASTYAVDSYKPIAGSIFVTITVNKNLWGYGLSEFITPWTQRSGFIPAIMLNMVLTTFFCAWGIVFYFYGKRLRKITANSKVHQM